MHRRGRRRRVRARASRVIHGAGVTNARPPSPYRLTRVFLALRRRALTTRVFVDPTEKATADEHDAHVSHCLARARTHARVDTTALEREGRG